MKNSDGNLVCDVALGIVGEADVLNYLHQQCGLQVVGLINRIGYNRPLPVKAVEEYEEQVHYLLQQTT